MGVKNRPMRALLIGGVALAFAAAGAVKPKHAGHTAPAPSGPAVLWTNPADLESRNLFYGPGGKADVPRGPFFFVKEDLNGTNPKFIVRDQEGVKWKVKLGIEARPETAASRLVWAVGYYADEDYFVRDLTVHEMPVRLHRGQELVDPDGTVHHARLKREPESKDKLANWHWRHDAFTGTREWNGLRTLMAVINNWDLKDVNNAIREEGGERIYLVSDLGGSFGCAGRCWPRDRTKGDLDKYNESRFIRRLTPETVDFETPARPRFVYLVNPKEYLSRVRLEWIGKNVPRRDARWLGQLLARLSPRQIRDAFRAAGYSPAEADGFYRVLAGRIDQLTDL